MHKNAIQFINLEGQRLIRSVVFVYLNTIMLVMGRSWTSRSKVTTLSCERWTTRSPELNDTFKESYVCHDSSARQATIIPSPFHKFCEEGACASVYSPGGRNFWKKASRFCGQQMGTGEEREGGPLCSFSLPLVEISWLKRAVYDERGRSMLASVVCRERERNPRPWRAAKNSQQICPVVSSSAKPLALKLQEIKC